MPSRRTVRGPFPVDLIVFLAILVTGCILVLVAHISPQTLAGYTTALASLFAAWHHRPQPPRPEPGPHTTPRTAPTNTTP